MTAATAIALDRLTTALRVLCRSGKRPRPATPLCAICHTVGHNRTTCPARDWSGRGLCPSCYGLHHRRPLRGCITCGGFYRSDRVTLDDVLEQPRKQRC